MRRQRGTGTCAPLTSPFPVGLTGFATTHFPAAGAKVEPSVFHTMPLKALKQEVSMYENKFNRMLVTTLPFPHQGVTCARAMWELGADDGR